MAQEEENKYKQRAEKGGKKSFILAHDIMPAALSAPDIAIFQVSIVPGGRFGT
jgi:hypothetical protein